MKNPKISHKKPLIWPILQLIFGFEWDETKDHNGFCWAFGNTIYAKHYMQKEIIVHEMVHLFQQRYSKIYGTWHLLKYTFDKKFRIETEILAFREQYKYTRRTFGRKIAETAKPELARRLALYGIKDPEKIVNNW